jgi:uncharacterized membrane protein YeaQ/YmgE (transglycosylase-associated protein family)
MTLGHLIVLLAIAGVCGSIGSGLAGHRPVGCLGSIALGFIGAWLGRWLSHALHLPEIFVISVGADRFPVVWSIAGATLFVAVIYFLTRPRAQF